MPSQIHNVAAATTNHSAYSISACCWLLDTQPRGLPPNTDSNLVLAQGSQCKSAAILQSRKLWNIINNIKTESRRSKILPGADSRVVHESDKASCARLPISPHIAPKSNRVQWA